MTIAEHPYLELTAAQVAERVELGEPIFCPRCGTSRLLLWARLGAGDTGIVRSQVEAVGGCLECQRFIVTMFWNLCAWLPQVFPALGGKK